MNSHKRSDVFLAYIASSCSLFGMLLKCYKLSVLGVVQLTKSEKLRWGPLFTSVNFAFHQVCYLLRCQYTAHAKFKREFCTRWTRWLILGAPWLFLMKTYFGLFEVLNSHMKRTWCWWRLKVDKHPCKQGLEVVNRFKMDPARLQMHENPSSNAISHENTGCYRESLDNSPKIKQQYVKSQGTRMLSDSLVCLEIHPACCHDNMVPLPHPLSGIEFGPVFPKQWFSP